MAAAATARPTSPARSPTACSRAPRGRAMQMNAGAAVAHGDVLLFLHADTRLPDECRPPGAGWSCRVRAASGAASMCASTAAACSALVAIMMNCALAPDRHRHRRSGDVRHPRGLRSRRRLSAHRADGGRGAVGAAQAPGPAARLARARDHSPRRWRKHGTLRTMLLMWRLRLSLFPRRRSGEAGAGLRLCPASASRSPSPSWRRRRFPAQPRPG